MNKKEWVESLKPGDEVCDCRFKHQKIKTIDVENDAAILEDGYGCSPMHCLDPVDHKWKHGDL